MKIHSKFCAIGFLKTSSHKVIDGIKSRIYQMIHVTLLQKFVIFVNEDLNKKEVDGNLRSFKAPSTFNDLYIRFVILYS